MDIGNDRGPDDSGSDAGPDEILDISVDDDDELPPLPQQPAEAGDVLSIDLGDLDDLPPSPAAAPAPGRTYPAADLAPAQAYQALAAKKGFVAPSVVHVISYLLAGAIGGFISWLLSEPFITDRPEGVQPDLELVVLIMGRAGLIGACLGGMIGMTLGAVHGLSSRVWEKAGMGAVWGLLIGGACGFGGGVIGQIVFMFSGVDITEFTVGLIVARAIGWGLIGAGVGLGQGFLMRSRAQLVNGLIGGAVGGFIGGLLFDPLPAFLSISIMQLTGGTLGGELSRLVAMVVMGAACGASIRIVEEARKTAWLRVVEGPLTGKEFILYRFPTLIGSSPKCDITLALDKRIAPQHAQITDRSGQHLVEDLGAPAGTTLNGRPVRSQRLRTGDIITMGGTSLLYACRSEKGPGAGG